MNEIDFVDRCGLDAYMFLDFLNKSFFLFIGFSILAIPILIPLNAYNQLSLGGLNQLTIGNVADQNRLWGHLILTVLFCSKCLFLYVAWLFLRVCARRVVRVRQCMRKVRPSGYDIPLLIVSLIF